MEDFDGSWDSRGSTVSSFAAGEGFAAGAAASPEGVSRAAGCGVEGSAGISWPDFSSWASGFSDCFAGASGFASSLAAWGAGKEVAVGAGDGFSEWAGAALGWSVGVLAGIILAAASVGAGEGVTARAPAPGVVEPSGVAQTVGKTVGAAAGAGLGWGWEWGRVRKKTAIPMATRRPSPAEWSLVH